MLCQSVLPSAFGNDSMPHAFSKFHSFLSDALDDANLIMLNHDLVGFFTSIPADRILAAVAWVVEQYQAQHDLRPDSSITVLLKERNTRLRTFQGKVRRGACRERQLRLCDVLPLAKLSLEASLFVNMKQNFQQVRGSAIGNQVSPILANLAVSVLEVDWRRRYDDPVERFSSRG